MSNLGRQKINIPEGVTIKINHEQCEISLEGKLGLLTQKVSKEINLILKENELSISSTNKRIWGAEHTQIQNSIIGVSQGFQKRLKLVGIGFRVQKENQTLKLKLGFSHDVFFDLPEGIDAICPKPDQIVLFGTKKDYLHQIASKIRSLRQPDSYKGKGIQFENEILILKEGKKK
jgi:large subunit ribosomal protein L6